jgi:hypothetical protein|tara:strand:- start:5035 stop:5622 length:588 start_codon:yes stop_codon:yes gene_type:complete
VEYVTDEDYEDIRRVIALCFRGIKKMSDIDLERVLSFDMEWLSPDQSEQVVSKLMETGWLKGGRDELSPNFDIKDVSTPIGWFPRPSRLISPIDFGTSTIDEVDNSKSQPAKAKPETTVDAKVPLQISSTDPRSKLSSRLMKYIARQTKIPVEEIERRAERKQKALGYATIWLSLALIAREQNLVMEQIITALSS